MATFHCQQCQSPFERTSHLVRNPPRFCSKTCSGLAQRNRVTLVCVECHQSFDRKAYMADRSQERGPFCGLPCYARWQQREMRGTNNTFYQADAHIDCNCSWCGREFVRARYLLKDVSQTFCDRDCFQSFAAANYTLDFHPRSGQPGHQWRGANWRDVRQQALARDYFECQHCGSTSDLVVHHIVEFARFASWRDANELGNLTTLCTACHRRLHNQLRP